MSGLIQNVLNNGTLSFLKQDVMNGEEATTTTSIPNENSERLPPNYKNIIWGCILNHPTFKDKVDFLIAEYLLLFDPLFEAMSSPAEVEAHIAYSEGYNTEYLQKKKEPKYPPETPRDNPHADWQEFFVTRQDVSAAYIEQLAVCRRLQEERERELERASCA